MATLWPYRWLRALESLVELADSITVEAFMTSKAELTCVDLTTKVAQALRIARAGRYDQLPVRDGNDNYVGLILLRDLEEMKSGDVVRSRVLTPKECPPTKSSAKPSEVLRELVGPAARLVVEGDQVVGLVHQSDLNKHAARAYFYLSLSAAEVGLAALIQSHYGKREWMKFLRSRGRKKIRNRIAQDGANRMDLNPIEYADLPDLIHLVRHADLLSVLGFERKPDWDREVAGLDKLRNAVMHPVRRLISDGASVAELLDRESRLRALVTRLGRAGAVPTPVATALGDRPLHGQQAARNPS